MRYTCIGQLFNGMLSRLARLRRLGLRTCRRLDRYYGKPVAMLHRLVQFYGIKHSWTLRNV
ncbi:MAG: hypothetical protein WBF43_08225 [Methylocella sp.]